MGTYSLRLKVDNGESIVYKFFDLTVNSGLDEGILVLNNDENFNGKLTFIKTLNEDEDEATEQTFFEDSVSLINPGITFTHSRDLYIADKNSDGKYPALILSTTDETGTILKFDPRSEERRVGKECRL